MKITQLLEKLPPPLPPHPPTSTPQFPRDSYIHKIHQHTHPPYLFQFPPPPFPSQKPSNSPPPTSIRSRVIASPPKTTMDLRSRHNVPASEQQQQQQPPDAPPRKPRGLNAEGGRGVGRVLDVLRVLGGVVLLSCTLSYLVTGSKSFVWNYNLQPQRLRAWIVNGFPFFFFFHPSFSPPVPPLPGRATNKTPLPSKSAVPSS